MEDREWTVEKHRIEGGEWRTERGEQISENGGQRIEDREQITESEGRRTDDV
jgi:hypothetical protein